MSENSSKCSKMISFIIIIHCSKNSSLVSNDSTRAYTYGYLTQLPAWIKTLRLPYIHLEFNRIFANAPTANSNENPPATPQQVWRPKSIGREAHLELDVGEVPDKRASDQIGGLLAPDAGDADDPPLRPRLGEVIEVELLGPGGELLLGLLDEPLLHFLPPVKGRRPALPPLVPELPPLPSRQGIGAGGLESRGDRRRRMRGGRGPSGDPGSVDWRAEEEEEGGGGERGAEVVAVGARTPLEKSLFHLLLLRIGCDFCWFSEFFFPVFPRREQGDSIQVSDAI